MADLNIDENSISVNNSTSTPLGASAVFTGAADDVGAYNTISVAVFANVASGPNGLRIEFSVDGTNWDFEDDFTIPGGRGRIFTVGRTARYFRIVYENGATAQTAFRLQVIFNNAAPKPSTHKVQNNITDDDDAELVKAVVTGEDFDVPGAFINVQTKDGRLLVSNQEITPVTGFTIVREVFSDVASTTGVDDYYTITSGKVLTLQTFSSGSEGATGGSVSELFYDVNGDLSVLDRITTIFTDASSTFFNINESFTGNGTRRIVMRRRGYSANAREMAARWRGFEV